MYPHIIKNFIRFFPIVFGTFVLVAGIYLWAKFILYLDITYGVDRTAEIIFVYIFFCFARTITGTGFEWIDDFLYHERYLKTGDDYEERYD